jgi:BR serine/threonine kinase/MAP/microtubule affinity-regulating kinase
MEKIDDKDTIDSKYIIIDKKGHGASSSVYLVREIKTQKVYAAKVLKKEQDLFQNEINILNILKPYKNPNITNLVSSGKGLIFREKSPQKSTPYLVLEYASKGEFFNYIYYAHSGFNELHSKYIFSKILNGIETCHNAGICHRDLKMQNI